jgi:MSHA biogenesis protein MshQ
MRFTLLLPLLGLLAAADGAAQTATVYTLPASLTASPFSCTLSSGVYNCPSIDLSKTTILRLSSNVAIKVNGTFSANKEFSTENNGYTLSLDVSGSVDFKKEVDATMTLKTGGSLSIDKDAIFNGNITAVGDINIAKDGVINGNVTTNGKLTVAQGTVINGTCFAAGGSNYACQVPVAQFDHVRLSHNGVGVTCTASYVTVNACSGSDANGSCATSSVAVAGTVYARSAAGVLLASSPFSIGAGQGATRVGLQVTSAQTATFSVGNLTQAPVNPYTCWDNNSGVASCNHSYTDSAFQFDVPDHVAGVPQTIAVRAVRKSDNAMVCAPAFTAPTPVNLQCAYSNPISGSQAVVANGVALKDSSGACAAGGQSVTLNFDDNGYASTTVTYPDAGSMTLKATYAATNTTGSDSFVAAPKAFRFSRTPAATVMAAVPFSATVTAVNNDNVATPNFGKESTPAQLTLGLNKCQPSGGAAGIFSGTLGGFDYDSATGTNSATGNNLKWSEVGLGYLTATLAGGGYLGSAITVSGTMDTGAGACGGAIRFTPAYLTTALAPAQVYAYSGQPVSKVRITPFNASGAVTTNYTDAPGVARKVTLAAYYANASGAVVPVPPATGALSGKDVLPSAFLPASPVGADATPAYTFVPPASAAAAKPAPLQLIVRAEDEDHISSVGHAEASINIRFGRLRLFNAFGSANASLTMSLQAQYWSGGSWLLNSEDSTTTIPDTAMALNASGVSGVSVQGLTVQADGSRATVLSGGQRTLRLLKSNTTKGYVDVAANLGSLMVDSSCLSVHPASVGAALPWLRALNGGCSSYSDPSARATFGIFAPENKATIHVRETFN